MKYYKYSKYLKDKYGAKTYKLPVNLILTCPNRDGELGVGGCNYCGAEGASFEEASQKTVKEQLLELKDPIAEKYNAEQFIAYFQNFTNTYLPLDELIANIEEALEVEDIVEVALATRPDCMSRDYALAIADLVAKKAPEININLELGLQSINPHTLKDINRGHSLAEFIDAVKIAQEHGFDVGVHLILNLPGDEMLDVIESAKVVSALGVDNVKLHSLYLREDTELGKQYQEGELEMISVDEYIDRVIKFLEYLDPKIGVQRLLGKAPQEETLFVNWGYNYSEVNNLILAEMAERDSYQGKKFSYLDGQALQKFE